MCEMCAEFERQIRDLTNEVEALNDRREHATVDHTGRDHGKTALNDRQESVTRALTEAKALYDHHRLRKHA